MTVSGRLSLDIDEEAGAAYLQFNDNEVARTVECTDDIVVDLDEHGIVVGVELLDLSKSVPLDELVEKFHIRTESLEMLLNALRVSSATTSITTYGTDTDDQQQGVVSLSAADCP